MVKIRMLEAFRVNIIDFNKKTNEEKFFPSYKWAHSFASKRADQLANGLTILYENVGSSTFEELCKFQRDVNYSKEIKEDNKNIRDFKADSAYGRTHHERWKSAIADKAITVVKRKRKEL